MKSEDNFDGGHGMASSPSPASAVGTCGILLMPRGEKRGQDVSAALVTNEH